MSWRSRRLFVCNINFSGEDFIRILVEFFKIFDQTTILVGNAAVLFSSEVQSEKDFLKNYSVTNFDQNTDGKL